MRRQQKPPLYSEEERAKLIAERDKARDTAATLVLELRDEKRERDAIMSSITADLKRQHARDLERERELAARSLARRDREWARAIDPRNVGKTEAEDTDYGRELLRGPKIAAGMLRELESLRRGMPAAPEPQREEER